MTKLTSLLGATCLALGLLATPTHAAATQKADDNIVQALMKCDNTFFQALAKEKRIDESYKEHEGDMAYFKIVHHPLEELKFKKPFNVNGLTITGAVINDRVIRYFGFPEMHSYFWGLLVKEDFETTLSKLRQDWEELDMNHKMAALPMWSRKNGAPVWEKFKRPENRQLPELDQSEKGFAVMPYGNQTLIFCGLQSANQPDEAILKSSRPDLLFGEKTIDVIEPLDDHNRPHVNAEGKNVRTGKDNKIPDTIEEQPKSLKK